jgi:hypothetical protein
MFRSVPTGAEQGCAAGMPAGHFEEAMNGWVDDLFDAARAGTPKHQLAAGAAAAAMEAERVARAGERKRAYCSPVCTLAKVPDRMVPMPLTTATMTSAIPAAIIVYSIAVAPDSSAMNDDTRRRMVSFPAGSGVPFGNYA